MQKRLVINWPVMLLLVLMTSVQFVKVASANSEMPAPAEILHVDAAVALALSANPSLAASQARAAAMAEVPAQAGALPDPRLMLNAMNVPVDSYKLDQEPMTQLQIGISQALPFPGKRSLKRRTASFEAEAAGLDTDEHKLRLINSVRQVWWQVFFLDRSLETVARNQNLLRQLLSIAQTKYKVGEGLQQDVLLAQMELSRLFDQEVTLSEKRRTAEIRLNTLMNRSAGSRVQLPNKADIKLPDPTDISLRSRQAQQTRPLLLKSQAQLDAANSRVELANKDFYPDFNLGAIYGQRDGWSDMASLQFSMSLPLYTGSKQQRVLSQRKQEAQYSSYALQDANGLVESQIEIALAQYSRAHELTVLFKTGIIPQSRQTVDSMRAGYQVNKVDFLNLVQAQVTLFNNETRYWQAYSEANQALATIAAAIGMEKVYE